MELDTSKRHLDVHQGGTMNTPASSNWPATALEWTKTAAADGLGWL